MYYAVVGIQEDIETTLCVMERYVPLFFKGALDIYRRMGIDQVVKQQGHNETGMETSQINHKKLYSHPIGTFYKFVRNETPNKKKLSEQARRILAANMTMEYDFFQFVKQRLHLQKVQLKKQTSLEGWCNDNRA